jgi:epoxyqueuosine reductase
MASAGRRDEQGAMKCDAEELRARLRELGFDAVRFAEAGPAPGGEALGRGWEAGLAADMAWMGRTLEKRGDPRLVLEGARTMVMLGVNYGGAPEAETNRPAWARYALHDDYHDTMRAGLMAAGRVLEELAGATAADYRYYVDTGPVLERAWAAEAGLGFVGKNAMLISREFGNWLFLAAIVTRVEVAPDAPIKRRLPPGRAVPEGVGLLCGKCSRCLEACPTGALTAPGVLDARKCISYQTIENRGVIPRELRAAIGHRIYGCDVCLEVCPWNRFAQAGRRVLLTVRGELAELPLTEILTLTPERFAAVFKGTAVKRLKLRGLLRNACIVAANTGARECTEILVTLATSHAEPLVRAHAVWAVRRLGEGARLAGAAERETDAVVRAEFAD